jgi:hypothetical protein
MAKSQGKPVFEVEGLQIIISQIPAKREGRDRIWIQIRQGNEKPWRMAATLAYPHALDVRFEREKRTPGS